MDYPRLCKNCNQPFTGRNKFHVFCSADCGKGYYSRVKKLPDAQRIKEIDDEMEKEWNETEVNPTNCYKCGEVMGYWTYKYSMQFGGRICKKCARKGLPRFNKCNNLDNPTSSNV